MGGNGYTCAVKDCKNTTSSTKRVSFFRFPKDLQRAELWLKFCNRSIKTPLEKLHTNYRICGEHFISSMFLNDLKNRLQPHAIPTILSANLESLPEVSRLSMQYAIVDCPSIKDQNNKLLFCFPQETIAGQQIKTVETNLIPNQSSTINEIYFANFSNTKKRLKTDVLTSVIDTQTEETDTRKEKTNTKRTAEEASIRKEEIEETSQENIRKDSSMLEKIQLKIQRLEEENAKLKDLIQSFQEKHENDLKNQANSLNVIIQENQTEFQQKLTLKNKQLKLLRMKLKKKDDIIYELLTTARTE